MKNEVFSVRNTDMDDYQFLHLMNLLGMGYQNRSELYTVIYLDNNSVSGLFSRWLMGIILSYKEAVRLIQKHKNDEIVPNAKGNFKPQPRFHKKRKPVPVREKSDLIITYVDGSKYSLKNVKGLSIYNGEIRVIQYMDITKDGKIFQSSNTLIPVGEVDVLHLKTPKGKYLISLADGIDIETETMAVQGVSTFNWIDQ